jgi:hypothetical protein
LGRAETVDGRAQGAASASESYMGGSMRKHLKLPSPAMTVALIALVMASTGAAGAAVYDANNARAVDGLSAVPNGTDQNTTAGKLVATQGGRLSANRGKIHPRYLNLNGIAVRGNGLLQDYAQVLDVPNNATSAPVALVTVPSFGTVQMQCRDEQTSPTTQIENPRTVITIINQSGAFMNVGQSPPTVSPGADIAYPLANGTVSRETQFQADGLFTLRLQARGQTLNVEGVVRQDGLNTTAAQCLAWGQAMFSA